MVNRRQFRHASRPQALRQNALHNFGLSMTLKHFASNSAYTMIPKNGCSTLRLSFSIANGCISRPEQKNWIHSNNPTFAMTTETAFLADYTFVILRCPFRRLYSAFLDKVVNMDMESWGLYNQTNRKIHPHDISFDQFIGLVIAQPPAARDLHWRPQVDYLLFENYDDYFSLEKFHEAQAKLEQQLGMVIYDSRKHVGHDITNIEKRVVPDAASLTAFELLQMKRQGHLPSIDSLYSESAREKVANAYQEDIALYTELFGRDALHQCASR